MLRLGTCILLSFVFGTAVPAHSGAQTATDQIAIVIPAVQRGTADLNAKDAELISFILGQSIKRYFLRGDKMHRSALVTIPAPLASNQLAAMSTLARVNGAQIAVFMKAYRQLDGALISTVMTIPEPYRDFRTMPFEVLNLTFKEKRISLDVPSRYVLFPSFFLEPDVLQKYKSGSYREICPIDRCDTDQVPNVVGKCLRLGDDVRLSETVRYREFAKTEALLMLDGVCYQQKLPANGPLSQPVLDFIVGVHRYFVGDWSVARKRMLAVTSAGAGLKADIRLQAYLYLSRISLRLDSDSDARNFLESASAINEKDPGVSETRQFLNFWLLARSVQAGAPDRAALLTQTARDLSKLPPTLQRPYLGLLEALKASI
jgi:hypothetical protein